MTAARERAAQQRAPELAALPPAALPQAALRGDRLSAHLQAGHAVGAALSNEARLGRHALERDAVEIARRFSER